MPGMNHQRILLTGATGFIGRHLLPRLEQQGSDVRCLRRPEADLLEPDSLPSLCEARETVIHLAGSAHVNRVDVRRVYAINATGTEHLLQAAMRAGVKHFIYMSSILADPEHDRPRSPYGQSKHYAEQALLKAHRAGDIRVTILRPVNVYGPGMKGNLMTLIRLAQRGRLPPLPDLPERFSLVSVADLCQAVMLAAEQGGAAADSDTPVYPVTDGHAYSLREVETAIRQALGQRQPRWALPRSALFMGALGLEVADRFLRLDNAPGLRNYHALTRGRVVDDRAIREALGYEPAGRFQDSLPELVNGA
ncbi:MAG: NAD-dependent epimerase/dehydratase family protein [Pseudohongiellaceae bacterium]